MLFSHYIKPTQIEFIWIERIPTWNDRINFEYYHGYVKITMIKTQLCLLINKLRTQLTHSRERGEFPKQIKCRGPLN